MIWILLLLTATARAANAQLSDLLTRIEDELFPDYKQCDLGIDDQVWAFLNLEQAIQDRPWFTFSSEAAPDLGSVVEISSSCSILVALSPSTKKVKANLEELMVKKVESAFVLLKVDPDSFGNHDCWLQNWNRAKVTFILDLTKEGVRVKFD